MEKAPPDTVDPSARTAVGPDSSHSGPVTLINSFVVPLGREDAFMALWTTASRHFRAQPGYRSLRLHRAVSADSHYRFVNVAEWESAPQFAAAHAHPAFKSVVADPRWREFPSNPALYVVVAAEHA